MNNILSISHNIFVDILENDLSFSLAINKPFRKKVNDLVLKSNASALVGCALRHQILFKELIKRYFGEVPTRVKSGIMLYLANKLFINKVDEKEAFEFMKQKFIDAQIEFDNKKYSDMDEATNDKQSLIPSEYDSNSLEFLSFRFNTPLWLIKMWRKQFGPQLIYPILSANSKGAGVTYRVNTFNIPTEDFLNEHPNFSKSELKDMVFYSGAKADRKHALSECPQLIEMQLGYKKLFDLLDCDPIRGITFYQGLPNNAFLELVAQYSNNVKFEIVAKEGEAYFSAKRNVEKYALENVAVYSAQPSSIITCISQPVHTFIVFPESSNFAAIRTAPDYLYHFSSDSLDGILNNQKEALEEASQFVEDGGNLVYGVSTLNHKEGRAQVINFLNNHKEFKLVEDRQIFPFDKLNSTLYYAILRKEEIKND